MNNQEAINCLNADFDCHACKYHKIDECHEKEAYAMAIAALEKQINGGWVKCSDRLPSKKASAEEKSNLFEVTKIISGKFRITDYCLIHTDYKTWHIRENEEVVAWRKKEEPYKESEEE